MSALHFLRFFLAFPTNSLGVWLTAEQLFGQLLAITSNSSSVEFAKRRRFQKAQLQQQYSLPQRREEGRVSTPPPPDYSTGSEWENVRLRWRATRVSDTIPVHGSRQGIPEDWPALVLELLWDVLPGVQLKRVLLPRTKRAEMKQFVD